MVALRKESVDRNGLGICHYRDDVVALRKESVDRNFHVCVVARGLFQVALRKESVDRNSFNPQQRHFPERRSPQGERG